MIGAVAIIVARNRGLAAEQSAWLLLAALVPVMQACVACHAAGVANAPKLGDKAAWAPRIATGKEALLKSVLNGKGAMPPKAGAADLKDDDLKAAIDYMTAAAK